MDDSPQDPKIAGLPNTRSSGMKAISRFLFVAMLAVVPGACDNSGRPPDTTPPTIALTGDNPQTIAVGEAYVELGATATDNRDGDLSASIVVDASAVDSSVPGEYAVTYGVIDSSGNAATVVTRTVIYEDRTAPVITLLGENPQIIVLGGDYAELGATATDNVDGDLTVSVVHPPRQRRLSPSRATSKSSSLHGIRSFTRTTTD
jgi:hypothetical protein